MAAHNIPKELCYFLEKNFNESIDNLTIDVHQGNQKGDGYLGELLFVSLNNNKTQENYDLVIKQASSRNYPQGFVTATYINEINFYTKIWPAMDAFQKLYQKENECLKSIPKCYCTDITEGSEKVILENLKFKNYQLHPKSLPLDYKHYEEIFKLYGKYHGISFAMKKLDSDKFLDLTRLLQNNWTKFFTMLPGAIGIVCNKVKNLFDPNTEQDILDKFTKYRDSGNEMILESIKYNGAYSVILHGDCWSNNLLFKFNDSLEVEHIKMIDFQMQFLGSTVHDLSYSFYSGAGKENLNKLEVFLRIYHKNLTETLHNYGFLPEETYTFENLKEEWKKYCKFGFIVGLLVLSTKENSKERMKWLVKHMHDYELL